MKGDKVLKRKPTRPVKVPTGTKTKKRRIHKEYLESMQTLVPLKKERFLTDKVKYLGIHPTEEDNAKLTKLSKQPDNIEFVPDPNTDKTEIIEILDGGTSLPEFDAHNLLRELDCFELKNEVTPEESKATQIQRDISQVSLPSMQCPIHQINVVELESRNGWEYIKCPNAGCLLFTSKEDAVPYMRAMQCQLHHELKKKWSLLMCFCCVPSTLKISRSSKNPECTWDATRKDAIFSNGPM